MINPNFYTKKTLVESFRDGLKNYPRKERHKVLKHDNYDVQYGETLYDITKSIFGKYQEYQWTYLADLNGGRNPFSLVTGETIKVPTVVVMETTKRIAKHKTSFNVTG